MKYDKRLLSLVALVALVMLVAPGCMKLGGKKLEKRYYTFDVKRKAPVRKPVLDSLIIRTIEISPMYDSRELVYKMPGNRVDSDFYNVFFLSPDKLVTQVAASWLQASGVCMQVVASGSLLKPERVLEGAINAIYGDYSGSSPAAVLNMQFFMVNLMDPHRAVLYSRDFKKRVPIADQEPGSLMDGYSKALAEIMAELEADLAKMK